MYLKTNDHHHAQFLIRRVEIVAAKTPVVAKEADVVAVNSDTVEENRKITSS